MKTGLPVPTGEGAKKYTEDDLTKFTSGLMSVLGFQSNTYSIKVKDKDWGNGAAIVKNADGSYTYDASERTENADGTCTVKTDTQTLTGAGGRHLEAHRSGEGERQRLRRRRHKPGSVISRRLTRPMRSRSPITVSTGQTQRSSPTASIDLAKVKAYAEENKDLLSCLVYKTAEFTPEKESGSIDMDYTFNSNDVIDRLSGEPRTSWSSRSCSRAASRTLPMRLPFPSSRANAIRTTRTDGEARPEYHRYHRDRQVRR